MAEFIVSASSSTYFTGGASDWMIMFVFESRSSLRYSLSMAATTYFLRDFSTSTVLPEDGNVFLMVVSHGESRYMLCVVSNIQGYCVHRAFILVYKKMIFFWSDNQTEVTMFSSAKIGGK